MTENTVTVTVINTDEDAFDGVVTATYNSGDDTIDLTVTPSSSTIGDVAGAEIVYEISALVDSCDASYTVTMASTFQLNICDQPVITDDPFDAETVFTLM